MLQHGARGLGYILVVLVLVPFFVGTAQQLPEVTCVPWVRVGNTGFTGGYGQVLVATADGFLIFRQYQANTKLELERYSVSQDGSISMTLRKTWPSGRTVPPDFKPGTAAAWDGTTRIYFLLGAYEEKDPRSLFYVYDISTDSWAKLADTPETQGAGNALVHIRIGDDEFLYAFVGQRKQRTAFLRYHVAEDRWEGLTVPEGWVYTDDGASLVWPHDGHVYALQGSGFEDMPTPSFARFRLPDGPWENLPPVPDPAGVNDGGSLAWDGGRYIYAISGGYGEDKAWKKKASGLGFYLYDLVEHGWRAITPSLPCPIGKYTGNRLAVIGEFLFLWQGTPESWECGGKTIWRTAMRP